MWKLPFIFVFLCCGNFWRLMELKSQGKVHLDQTFTHGRIRQKILLPHGSSQRLCLVGLYEIFFSSLCVSVLPFPLVDHCFILFFQFGCFLLIILFWRYHNHSSNLQPSHLCQKTNQEAANTTITNTNTSEPHAKLMELASTGVLVDGSMMKDIAVLRCRFLQIMFGVDITRFFMPPPPKKKESNDVICLF